MQPELLTTTQAAERVGMTPSAFRGAMTRARQAGLDARAPIETWPDRRTPLYDAARVREILAARPGPGWFGPHTKTSNT